MSDEVGILNDEEFARLRQRITQLSADRMLPWKGIDGSDFAFEVTRGDTKIQIVNSDNDDAQPFAFRLWHKGQKLVDINTIETSRDVAVWVEGVYLDAKRVATGVDELVNSMFDDLAPTDDEVPF